MTVLTGAPYLYSGYNFAAGQGINYGQLPGAAGIENWAGLMPPFSISGIDFSGPYTVTSLSNFVQAIFQDPTSGQWQLGGWSTVPAAGQNGPYWRFDNWGSLGTPPSQTVGLVSSQCTGFGSLAFPGVAGLTGWNTGDYAPGNGDSGYYTLTANVEQGGPAGDFWLLAVGMESNPPGPFLAWDRPPVTDPWVGGTYTPGLPTIAASSVVASYEAMWVSGPIGVSLLNAYGFIVGVQGSDADGKNASPLYLFLLAQTGAGWDGDGLYGSWIYTSSQVDLPPCPAPPGAGVITAGCLLSGNQYNGNLLQPYPQPLSFTANVNLWAYQPNGDGTYSPWSLNFLTGVWSKFPVNLDVQPVQGGFWVSADNESLYLVGYSPSYGTNVAMQFSVLEGTQTGILTHLAGSEVSLPSGTFQDGYNQTYPGYSAYNFPHNPFPTVPATQLSTFAKPLVAGAGFVVDQGSAPYQFGNLGTNVDGTWLRLLSSNDIEGGTLPLPPLRRLQRSDSFGVRRFQVGGSANSPLSLRSYGGGNAHV